MKPKTSSPSLDPIIILFCFSGKADLKELDTDNKEVEAAAESKTEASVTAAAPAVMEDIPVS